MDGEKDFQGPMEVREFPEDDFPILIALPPEFLRKGMLYQHLLTVLLMRSVCMIVCLRRMTFDRTSSPIKGFLSKSLANLL